MNYSVIVMSQALEELDEAYDWLAAQTRQHAPEWYNGLLDAVLSLEEMPTRWPLFSDREEDDPETRQMIYGDKRQGFRILFVIRGSNVYVLRILHGARAMDSQSSED